MTSGLSLYLDLFRVLAVLVVVASHALQAQLGGEAYGSSFSLEALQGLFVLSGFLTAHVVAVRERNIVSFAAGRLSRIWSVLLPALAFTPLADALGGSFSNRPYEGWDVFMGFDQPLLRLAEAATFTNQIWFFSPSPLSNTPLWTLSFLAWFYALFAAYVFAPREWRFWAVAAVAVVAGPRVMLLAPGWLMGAWLYGRSASFRPRPALAAALFFLSISAIPILKALHVSKRLFAFSAELIGPELFNRYLAYSHSFLWQLVLSGLFCLHFVGAFGLASLLRDGLRFMRRALRAGAQASAAVYAVHFPLQLMVVAMLEEAADGPLKTGFIIVAPIVLAAPFVAAAPPLRDLLRTSILAALNRGRRIVSAV